MATKSRRVLANNAVLVSSKGFSAQARAVAKDEGIELRTWREVDDPRSIAELFPGFKFSWNERVATVLDSELYLFRDVQEDSALPKTGGVLLLKELQFAPVDRPTVRYSWAEFLYALNLVRDEFWIDVPPGNIPGLDGPVGIFSNFIFRFWPLPITCHHTFKKYQAGFPLHLVSTDKNKDGFRMYHSGGACYVGAVYLWMGLSQQLKWEKSPDRVSFYESTNRVLSRSLYYDFEKGGKAFTLSVHVTEDGSTSPLVYDPNDATKLHL